MSGLSARAQVRFIENQGQWSEKAHYKADLINGNIWVTDSGLLFNMWEADAAEQIHNRSLNSFQFKAHAFLMHFVNGSFQNIEALESQTAPVYNYYLGSDPSKWATGLHASGSLLVHDLYPGVDLRVYSNNGLLKYNLECSSSKSLNQVELEYKGVNSVSLSDGKLHITTSIQDFTDVMPKVYSPGKNGETLLEARYLVNGNKIRYQVDASGLSANARIIVDPVLVFSTYTGSSADNFGCTGTYDDDGNGYAGGTVFSIGLPVSSGAYQVKFGGGEDENIGYGDGRDAAILKFSEDGKTLLYCTYLGGADNEQPHSMVIGDNGDLYIMGSTRSADFPVIGGADMSHNGDYDFFVSRLSSDGTALLGSTYLGGSGLDAVGANREAEKIDNFPLLYNYADEFRGEILYDGEDVYVGGVTYSINFPRSDNSGWFGGKEDACIFSLTGDLSGVNWVQMLGREGHDAFYGIALGQHNDIYASGGTTSNNLPSTFQVFTNSYLGGIADGLIARFNKKTGKLLRARYVGTTQYEQAYFAQTDKFGNPYFYGQTEGSFMHVNANYHQPGRGQFIVRYDSLLATVTLSSSFGANDNSPNISPSAFLVDQCERIFISGWGGEVNNHLIDIFDFKRKAHRNIGNTRNLQVTSDAHQKTTDGSDFYLAVFGKNMHSLLYATWFGGVGSSRNPAEEHVDGGTSRFDKRGIIYQSVCAGCGRNGLFPTTPGAYSRTNNSPNCNNALFKIDFENLNKVPVMRDTFIEIMATDRISFSLNATDPDPFDPVHIEILSEKNLPADPLDRPFIRIEPLLASAVFALNWQTGCKSWSKDTIEYKLLIYDKGCPQADSSYATIKILINEPPVVIPPESVCVSLERNSNNVKISWQYKAQDLRFFSHYSLTRINPDGSEQLLDTFRSFEAGFFVDVSAPNAATKDYCYYLTGFNTCGIEVKATNPFCTLRELNNPIEGVAVKFVTVEEDRRVKIAWESSREPDFKDYELYRYPRGESPGNSPWRITGDTVAFDSSFDVDAISNCYSLIVTDQCGHISKHSNPGCNVVISGSATGKPKYYFDLNWQDYVGWNQGVLSWELERQYKDNPWQFVSVSTDRTGRDDKLDFDWGGYWYRVTATEYVKGSSRAPEQSQSNWVYLIQPPEVYVPTGITINGDKLNDIWGTVPVFVREYNMKLFNRWGQKIWESDNKYNQWDGLVNSVQAEDGVFAWSLTFRGWDDKTYHVAGTVTIIH